MSLEQCRGVNPAVRQLKHAEGMMAEVRKTFDVYTGNKEDAGLKSSVPGDVWYLQYHRILTNRGVCSSPRINRGD
jgi:hypothetical protein